MKITFSKKAGLQMSINAIVVLVMAMVVLGLGLGFIRGMFSSAESKFSGAIDAADLTTFATTFASGDGANLSIFRASSTLLPRTISTSIRIFCGDTPVSLATAFTSILLLY